MRVEVLDHGYIELVESWGSDEQIIEAARMSTDKGFQGWGPLPCPACGATGEVTIQLQKDWLGPGIGDEGTQHAKCPDCKGSGRAEGDEKLLRYLYAHQHTTPFEMGGLSIEVQAPIFVFREWHRHRTQSYTEMSGRYIELPKLNYVPSPERIAFARQSKTNKQGSTQFEHGIELVQATVRTAFIDSYETAWAHYCELLGLGVARELASRVLPVSQYSKMRASANLLNWLRFLTLRMDSAAQWEIRQYATVVGELIAAAFPRTWALFSAAR